MKEQTTKSRQLRKNMTLQERKLWQYLRNRQINNCRFRRQYPIGAYIVDFICLNKKLIIEIDGGQHNEYENIKYDDERTEYFKSLGFRVVRFWNCDIDENIEGVYELILRHLGADVG